ncbi:CatB-related O-acetyltransferase [Roseovarius faecimaris]|nr:CatB-related O-acetyltransferase [Roseovarius faecimaris]
MKRIWGGQDNRLRLGKPGETKQQTIGSSRVSVGRFTYGYEHAEVYQWGEGADLEIGSFCSIGGGLRVYLGGNHRTDWVTTFPFGHVFRDSLGEFDIEGHPGSKGDVIIGHDVWIGANVTLLSGARIGHGAVIGTNATVAGEVGTYEIVGGNPARHLKHRFDEAIRQRLLELAWWDQPLEVIRRIAPMLSVAPDLEMLDRVADVIAQG